jgi:hypothetical protein
MKLVKGGSLCVRINDENSSFFKLEKGFVRVTPFLLCSLTWWMMYLLGCF